jgi:hypothetical protein
VHPKEKKMNRTIRSFSTTFTKRLINNNRRRLFSSNQTRFNSQTSSPQQSHGRKKFTFGIVLSGSLYLYCLYEEFIAKPNRFIQHEKEWKEFIEETGITIEDTERMNDMINNVISIYQHQFDTSSNEREMNTMEYVPAEPVPEPEEPQQERVVDIEYEPPKQDEQQIQTEPKTADTNAVSEFLIVLGSLAIVIPCGVLWLTATIYGSLYLPPVTYITWSATNHLRRKEQECIKNGNLKDSVNLAFVASMFFSWPSVMSLYGVRYSPALRTTNEKKISRVEHEFERVNCLKDLLIARLRLENKSLFDIEEIESKLDGAVSYVKYDIVFRGVLGPETYKKELEALIIYHRALFRSFLLYKAMKNPPHKIDQELFNRNKERALQDYVEAIQLNQKYRNGFGKEMELNLNRFEKLFKNL